MAAAAPPAPPAPGEELFRPAIAAAMRGDIGPVRAYLDAGGTLTARATAEDIDALQLDSSTPKSNLIDIALHNNHTEVVMELLGDTESGVPKACGVAVSTLRRR